MTDRDVAGPYWPSSGEPIVLCLTEGAKAALVTATLAATPAFAIDEGVPDRAGHPYVGVLAADPDGDGPQAPFIWCSGFVVSDSVFVTAAHCIVSQPPEAAWYVSLAAGSPKTPILEPGVFPDDGFNFTFLVPLERASKVVTHPDFGAMRTARTTSQSCSSKRARSRASHRSRCRRNISSTAFHSSATRSGSSATSWTPSTATEKRCSSSRATDRRRPHRFAD